MDVMEPDWEELDKKANGIIARHALVSAPMNVLPFGADILAVTAVFTRMTIELAGVYQVIVTQKRAKQMGSAIATAIGGVLGAAYTASRLVRLIPGSYFIGAAVQAPIMGAVVWAAGDALKGYFKQTRQGSEPGMDALRESFSRTLRLRLKGFKGMKPAEETPAPPPAATAPAGADGKLTTQQIIEKIAGLHELQRTGAITQADFDRKKAELLARM